MPIEEDIFDIKKGIQAMEEGNIGRWNKIKKLFREYPLTAIGGEINYHVKEYSIHGIDAKIPKEVGYNPLLKNKIWGNETLKIHLFDKLVHPDTKGRKILKSYPETTKVMLNTLKKASKIETEVLNEISPFIQIHDDLCTAEYEKGRIKWKGKEDLEIIDEIFGKYKIESIIPKFNPGSSTFFQMTKNKMFFDVLIPKFAESEFRKKDKVIPLLREYLEGFEFFKKRYEQLNH